MTITIKLFAQLRLAAGASEVELVLPAGATAAEAARQLNLEHPRVEPKGAMVAVNAAYADPDTVLHDGDTMALLPPVAGG